MLKPTSTGFCASTQPQLLKMWFSNVFGSTYAEAFNAECLHLGPAPFIGMPLVYVLTRMLEQILGLELQANSQVF